MIRAAAQGAWCGSGRNTTMVMGYIGQTAIVLAVLGILAILVQNVIEAFRPVKTTTFDPYAKAKA
jgi:hypothetical protein